MSAGDADGLADAIEKVIVDLSLAKKLGQAGHGRAETLFSIQKNVCSLLALFEGNWRNAVATALRAVVGENARFNGSQSRGYNNSRTQLTACR